MCEESSQLLYDEKVSRDEVGKWSKDGKGIDVHYLRVRVFKTEFKDRFPTYTNRIPVYLILCQYQSYAGDPDKNRAGKDWFSKKVFVKGPDSAIIRKAIAITDGFGGQREYDSK